MISVLQRERWNNTYNQLTRNEHIEPIDRRLCIEGNDFVLDSLERQALSETHE
jgi:hypothetical protein